MSEKKPQPPNLAVWFLQHLCPGDNEALTGDLLERFHEGKTRGWLWRQVLFAFAYSVLGKVRRYGPHLCYAIAGTVLPVFFWKTFYQGVPNFLHWYVLPWPWSMLVFELSQTALLAWTVLPVLAVGLMIRREFRWTSLLRTGVVNPALLVLSRYSIYLFPWLLRPGPRLIHQASAHSQINFLIIPPIFVLLLSFSAFFVSAWLGCRLPQHAEKAERPIRS